MTADKDADVADAAVSCEHAVKFKMQPSSSEIVQTEGKENAITAFRAALHERDKWELEEEERKRKDEEEDKMDSDGCFMQRFKGTKGGKGGSSKRFNTILKNIENGKRSMQHRNSF